MADRIAGLQFFPAAMLVIVVQSIDSLPEPRIWNDPGIKNLNVLEI